MAYIGNLFSINIASSNDKSIVAKASGGGVITSLLINTLKKKIIDAAIVVGMNKDRPYLSEVKVAKNKKEIIESAGSKYVLINFSEILGKIRANADKKLAVTAVPCHIRAIRKLQQNNKLKNVKLLIGLFCGYNMPFDATLFFLKKLKVKLPEIKELKYRGGPYPGGFFVKLKNGKKKFLPKHYYDFLNLMYVPKGCLNCQDFTNELADVSVGDCYGYPDSSVMIIRNKIAEDLTGNLKIKNIAEKKFLKMHWHNIKHKKKGDSLLMKLIRTFLRTFKHILPMRLLGAIAKLRRIYKKQI